MSDLISRKAILKNIEKIRQSMQMMDDTRRASIVMKGVYLCEKAVRNQPFVRPKPQWIPCSERLPETKEGELKRCLLTEELHLITGETVNGVCVAFYDGEYNTWFYDLGEDMEEVNYPLAWMPLPEPYAERRTDETQNT